MIDATHNPGLSSWVEGADEHPDFPVQNLPYGVFSTADEEPRVGAAGMPGAGRLGETEADEVDGSRGGDLEARVSADEPLESLGEALSLPPAYPSKPSPHPGRRASHPRCGDGATTAPTTPRAGPRSFMYNPRVSGAETS